MPAPSKAAQIAEAEKRGSRDTTNPANEGANANADLPGDTTAPEADAPLARDPTDTTRPPPGMKPTRVDRRAEIVASFREGRETSEAAEDVAELRQFAHDGIPPEMVREEEEPAAEDAEPAVTEPEEPEERPQPVLNRKVKVRGQEVDLSTLNEDQILAAVQKGLAGDSYFEEGRRVADDAKAALERVNALLAQQGKQGLRSPGAEHPGAEPAEPDGTAQPEHPEVDPYENVVNEIAFKDPKEAAASLRALVEGQNSQQRIQPVVTQALQQQRANDELARSKATRDRFATDRKDIADDPLAIAVLQQDIAGRQYQDLKALGFEDHQLPQTREEIGKWHLHYRGEGMRVRSMEKLFNESIAKYDEWKGAPKPAETGRQAPPRIAATIDRTERRTRLPQQPTRTAVPQRTNAENPQQRDRSAIVQEMQRDRKAPRTPPPRVARSQ